MFKITTKTTCTVMNGGKVETIVNCESVETVEKAEE